MECICQVCVIKIFIVININKNFVIILLNWSRPKKTIIILIIIEGYQLHIHNPIYEMQSLIKLRHIIWVRYLLQKHHIVPVLFDLVSSFRTNVQHQSKILDESLIFVMSNREWCEVRSCSLRVPVIRVKLQLNYMVYEMVVFQGDWQDRLHF